MSLPAPVVTCVDDGRMVLGTVACEKAVQYATYVHWLVTSVPELQFEPAKEFGAEDK